MKMSCWNGVILMESKCVQELYAFETKICMFIHVSGLLVQISSQVCLIYVSS